MWKTRPRGGAQAASLSTQATTALQYVPTAELVIIQTIDNDFRCAGTDDAHVPEYRVRWATSPGGPWTAIGRTTAWKFTATRLTNGTTYYFRGPSCDHLGVHVVAVTS